MKRRTLVYSLFAGACCAPGLALASPIESISSPTRFDGQPVTDWNSFWDDLSFDKLLNAPDAGSLADGAADPLTVQQLGYDPTQTFEILPGLPPQSIPISWLAGTPVANILPLGSLQALFSTSISELSLNDIAGLAGQSLGGLSLNDFAVSNWQSIKDLVTAIPLLGDTAMSALESVARPIADLIKQTFPQAFVYNTLNDALSAGKDSLSDIYGFGGQYLSQLNNLISYGLDEIQGLIDTAFGKFKAWQQSLVNKVPFLKNISWKKLGIPDTLSFLPTLAKVDLVLGTKEKFQGQFASSVRGFLTNTISGGVYSGFFNQPCQENECPHIELTGSALVKGKRIVSGLVQKVEGGTGFLKVVNGGKEPTGFEPFKIPGGLVKLVFTHKGPGDGSDSFQVALYFCVRVDIWGTKHETPKFIGPIPLLTVRTKQWIPVALPI